MKKILFWALPLTILVACGDDKNAEEVITLTNDKDKLSYAMGSVSAQTYVNDPSGQTQKLDFELMAKGFESNLNENNADACRETIKLLFGEQFTKFDSTYKEKGSECLGKLTAFEFYRQVKEVNKVNEFNMKMVAAGFRHGLNKADTLISKEERDKLIQAFVEKVTKEQQAKAAAQDAPFLDAAKKLPNTRVIDGGIVIETIKEGKGGSPTLYDDVEAKYAVTTIKGDTMDAWYRHGQTFKTNLQGQIIAGWKMSFPQLKKGGIYNVYIPSEFGYGQGALKFNIELVNYGKAGTIAQPQQQPQGAGF